MKNTKTGKKNNYKNNDDDEKLYTTKKLNKNLGKFIQNLYSHTYKYNNYIFSTAIVFWRKTWKRQKRKKSAEKVVKTS